MSEGPKNVLEVTENVETVKHVVEEAGKQFEPSKFNSKISRLKVVAHPFGAWTLWGYHDSQVAMPTQGNPNPGEIHYINILFIHMTYLKEYTDLKD